jgi:hypothetical protein
MDRENDVCHKGVAAKTVPVFAATDFKLPLFTMHFHAVSMGRGI